MKPDWITLQYLYFPWLSRVWFLGKHVTSPITALPEREVMQNGAPTFTLIHGWQATALPIQNHKK